MLSTGVNKQMSCKHWNWLSWVCWYCRSWSMLSTVSAYVLSLILAKWLDELRNITLHGNVLSELKNAAWRKRRMVHNAHPFYEIAKYQFRTNFHTTEYEFLPIANLLNCITVINLFAFSHQYVVHITIVTGVVTGVYANLMTSSSELGGPAISASFVIGAFCVGFGAKC